MGGALITEMTDDGPGSSEIIRIKAGTKAIQRKWISLLLPMILISAFILLVLYAILQQGVASAPPVAWVMLSFSVFIGAFFVARILPRRLKQINAKNEGRAGSYPVRLARGDHVWLISGFGEHRITTIGVTTMDASGKTNPKISDPDAAAWCLDAATGKGITPSRTVGGRVEDQSSWVFNPDETSRPQLFLTIDCAAPDTPGAWNARITVTCSGGPAPDRLEIQRLTPAEAYGLRPANL